MRKTSSMLSYFIVAKKNIDTLFDIYTNHQLSGQIHLNKAFHHLQMSSTDYDEVLLNCFLTLLKHKLNYIATDLIKSNLIQIF